MTDPIPIRKSPAAVWLLRFLDSDGTPIVPARYIAAYGPYSPVMTFVTETEAMLAAEYWGKCHGQDCVPEEFTLSRKDRPND